MRSRTSGGLLRPRARVPLRLLSTPPPKGGGEGAKSMPWHELRPLPWDEFTTRFQDYASTVVQPLWLSDEQHLKTWLALNRTSRGHGGSLQMKVALTACQWITGDKKAWLPDRIANDAVWAYGAVAEAFARGDLEAIAERVGPLLAILVRSYGGYCAHQGLRWSLTPPSSPSEVEATLEGAAVLMHSPALDFGDRVFAGTAGFYTDAQLTADLVQGKSLRGVFRAAKERAPELTFHVAVWVRLKAREQFRVMREGGDTLVEGGPLQEHVWKFVTPLREDGEREWQLVDIDEHVARRLRFLAALEGVRPQSGPALPLPLLWAHAVDIQ